MQRERAEVVRRDARRRGQRRGGGVELFLWVSLRWLLPINEGDERTVQVTSNIQVKTQVSEYCYINSSKLGTTRLSTLVLVYISPRNPRSF